MDVDVVIFETSPDILAVVGELLVSAGLLERCELHLVLQGTDVAAVLQRAKPKLAITSWRDIGPRVLAAAQELNPKPVAWVMSQYDPADVRREALHPVEQIFNKYELIGRSGLPLAVRGFLKRRPAIPSVGV